MARVSGKAVAVVIGLMLSALVVLAVGTTLAQTPVAPSAGVQAPTPQVPPPAKTSQAKQVQGTIKNVVGDTVTLADGTQLTIPASRSGQRDDLKPGMQIKARYEEKGDQKVVTSIQVQRKR